MSCNYIKWRSGWYCMKKGGDIGDTIYQKYCRYGYYDYKDCPIYKGKQDSGCYLTTACVSSRGLPDNCFELETLRAYRDNWLANIEGGKEEIKKYYEMAPKIIEEIDKTEDKESVYNKLYTDLVLKCVGLIQQEEYEAALDLYRIITLELEKKYC